MRWALPLLTIGVVLLTSCLAGRVERSADGCDGPPGDGCTGAGGTVLVGPGTFPLGTAYPRVVDVPAGSAVRVSFPVEMVPLSTLFAISDAELARYGLARPPHGLLADLDGWMVIEDVATGSEVRIRTLRATEIDRTIIRNRTILHAYDPTRGVPLYPDPPRGLRTLRYGHLYVLHDERRRIESSARFPADRFWPWPTAEAILARKPVDALFDQILASIRKADP